MEILHEKFSNIKYFIEGYNGSIIVPTNKILIAGKKSNIRTAGIALVKSVEEKEKCTIVTEGSNIIFDLPDKIEDFFYDPTLYKDNIIQSTIKYCVFKSANGSKYIGCRYMCQTHRFGSTFMSDWQYDLICYYDGSYYRLLMPKYVRNPEQLSIYKLLNITFEDMRYHVLIIINGLTKSIKYTYSEKPIDTSRLNSKLVDWQTHTTPKTTKDIKEDLVRNRDCYKNSHTFQDYEFRAFYRKA